MQKVLFAVCFLFFVCNLLIVICVLFLSRGLYVQTHSILAADFARLGDEIRAIDAAGADWIHLDIMDGHFVPNLTMGPALVKGIRPTTKLPFDCHLMVTDPGSFFAPFAKAGVEWISFHVEVGDTARLIDAARKLGVKVGLALNPATKVDGVLPYLMHIDYVLVMTVNPGFAGQEMVKEAIEKIGILKAWREAQKLNYLIQVDGGINLDTIHLVAQADVFVVGNGVFKTTDYAETIRAMKRQAA